MKIFSTLFCLLLFATVTNAQFKQIAEGPVFKEPEDGYAKIIQLKNGNTVFMVITDKDGIDVKVYDPSHKTKAEQHIEPAYGKLKGGHIEASFAINTDVVLMISEAEDRTPVLYRLIIDGNNGTLKDEKTIGQLNKVTMGQGYAMVFGDVPIPAFYVRKDPNSDNYAVALMNSFESDRNKRIEIVFYSGDHKELARAYYKSPNDKYKYMNFIDMAVMGSNKVSVLAYAFNTASSGGKERVMVIANLDAGAKDVTLDELSFTKDMYSLDGICRYNSVTQKLLLVCVGKEEKKSKTYSSFLVSIDPMQRKILKVSDIYPSKVNEKSMEIFGEKKGGYWGMPQNIYMNSDGGFTIVFEAIENITSTTTSGYSYTNAFLGNVAIATYDKDGKEKSEYFIPKRHEITNAYMPSFYLSWREGTAQALVRGNQYKSFVYLNGTNKNYILFNDVARNAESLKKGDLTTINGVGECDGFYFDASGKDIMPERQYVFGQPDSKKDHNLALFSISDYSIENNMYVTLKLAKEGRDKGVSVVWLQPQ